MKINDTAREFTKATGFIILISIINYYLLESWLGYRAVGFLFLATILFLSTFLKSKALVFSAVLSTFNWNFFFIPPKFTLIIHDKEDLMMVFSYFFAAIIGGVLATRIKKQEMELHHLKLKDVSKRLQDTLLNSVSHEMRTPLTVLIGSASALKEQAVIDNPVSREMMTSEIINSAQRLNRVVENLLDLNRLESGNFKLKKEWFSWEEFIRELRMFMGDDLKNCRFVVEGENAGYLEGDFTLLIHAFSNLISNSLRHSKKNTLIELKIKKELNDFRITFSDDGPGIDPDICANLFVKFSYSPKSRTGGLGLGLAIVKNIIELHEGSIELLDNNRGATFRIILPHKKSPINFEQ